MLSEVHKIAINYEITKKNRRKVLKIEIFIDILLKFKTIL